MEKSDDRKLLEMIQSGQISAKNAFERINMRQREDEILVLESLQKERSVSNIMNGCIPFPIYCYSLDREKGKFFYDIMKIVNGQEFQVDTMADVFENLILTGEEFFNDEYLINTDKVYYLFDKLIHNTQRPVNIVFLYRGNHIENPVYKAISSLFRILFEENSNLRLKTVELKDENINEDLIKKVVESTLFLQEFHELKFVNGIIYENQFEEINMPKPNEKVIWSEGAIVITGGNGKISKIVAEYLLNKQAGLIVLLGRGCASVETTKWLEKYEGNIRYFEADVTNSKQLEAVLVKIRKEEKGIAAIFHCAGIVKDAFFINKRKDEWDSVLEVKIKGTILLDTLTKQDNLNCFVCFSSIASLIPSIGQSDYSLANRFMDSYMNYREKLTRIGHRKGKSISINWSLWEDGGMHVSDLQEKTMHEQYGIRPLKSHLAMKVFDYILSTEKQNIVVLSGNKEKIRNIIELRIEEQTPILEETKQQESQMINQEISIDIIQGMQNWLKNILSEIGKIPLSKIKVTESLEKYGIDSLMIIDMNKIIEKEFGKVSKTVFFEYQTIEELAMYFVEHHYEKSLNLLGINNEMDTKNEKPTSSVSENKSEKVLIDEINIKNNVSKDDIAIIGLAGRYPDAENMDQFWINLLDRRDSVIEIPEERWDYKKNYECNSRKTNKTNCKWGSFIKDVDKFDSLFFNIAHREAELIDPQERLFLETAWNTVEDAGYTPDSLKDTTVGVYVGAMFSQYQMFGAESALEGNELVPGSSFASIANRVSYFMNFRGPSISVDTMCSSSLTAIHLATESIKRGECQVALAGGVNLILHPHKYRLLSQGGFLSSTGKCKSFGKGEGGYVPGEGIGAVLLKSLKEAKRDGDHIYAVIKSSSLNHGGKTRGFSVPNPNQQGKLIKNAIDKAGINAEDISYIEAHGTGTLLGDPIEITGLQKAFNNWTDKKQFCAIGSIKSNIGHLESAAGIAGITKILLQMKYKKLVPSIHAEVLNENISFEDTSFYVQRHITDWDNMLNKDLPRTASISAFGAGGSNVHMILQEFVENKLDDDMDVSNALIPFSAKNEERLKENLINFYEFIEKRIYEGRGTQLNENIILKDITKIVADILQVNEEDVHEHECWENIGWNAMMSEQLLYRLNDFYQIDLDFQTIINIHNCEELKYELQNNYIQKLNSHYGINSKDTNTFAEKIRLCDIAYTLQTGRKAMEERVVFYVRSVDELLNMIKKYLSGNADISNLFKGNIRENLDNDFFDDDDVELLVDKWVKLGKIDKLGQAWAKGVFDDWSFYSNFNKGKRISLPYYAFDKVMCWFPKETSHNIVRYEEYPFITENLSNLREVKFSTTFSWQEKFLIEEKETQNKILSPFLLIEMVLEAMKILELNYKYRVYDILVGQNVLVPHEGIVCETCFYALDNEIKFEVVTCEKDNVRVLLQGSIKSTQSTELSDLYNVKNGEIEYYHSDIFYKENEKYLIPPQIYLEILKLLVQSQENMEYLQVNEIGCVSIDYNNIGIKNLSLEVTRDEQGKVSFYILNEQKKQFVVIKNIKSTMIDIKKELSTTNIISIPSKKILGEWLEKTLICKVSELLKVDESQIDKRDSFTTFGFDSISLKQFADEINQFFNIEMSPTQFFDSTNVSDLIKYLLNEYFDNILYRYQKENEILPDFNTDKYNQIGEQIVPFSQQLNKRFVDNDYPLEDEPIAIIGMHGVYPQSRDLQEYWENLYDEKDLITEIPKERWDWQSFYSEEGAGKLQTGSRWGGFIPDVDKFDPRFFNMSPVEAAMMDPQHRIFLETVWKTFEDAGYKISEYSGKNVGMFVGVQFNDYQQLLAMQGESNLYMGLGNEHSILINRISYLFNFRGPSEPYNTACSSASVALHRAIHSIREGESEVAVVGGISLMLSPFTMIGADQLGILSPDGHCKTLDKSANGYVKGEGIGAILLKPLSKALKDKDNIYALVKGTAVNHGGKATSLTAPNKKAQAEVLCKAYEEAGITPDTVSYIELHGTGTELGDPIEIEGIKSAFSTLSKKNGVNIHREAYCGIGSVKTNIGHLEPASGMAGIMKVVLAMKHETLPGMLHLKEVNPYVVLKNSPFYIVKNTQPWNKICDSKGKEVPRRAGVSSFGFGGVNSHIVLEEYKEEMQKEEKEDKYIFVLSAKKSEQLKKKAEDLLEFLIKKRNGNKGSFRNVVYTLQVGREDMMERISCVVANEDELVVFLKNYIDNKVASVHINENQEVIEHSEEVEKALERRDYDKISDYWMQNYQIDWRRLYEELPNRVSLPLYPFARESYWVPNNVTIDTNKINSDPKQETLTVLEKDTDLKVNQIEDVLKQIISEELRFGIDELKTNITFDYYGIDSITSSNIMVSVQEIYGADIPLFAIVENPTIEELANYINQTVGGKLTEQRLIVSEDKKGANNKPVYPNEVVTLNMKGNKKTSFWFHGSLGYVQVYHALSRALGTDYPFYAFQAKGIDGKSMPYTDLEEMAKYYVSCIKQIQPEGPYYIGGYSLGGLVGYEVAQQLIQNGDEIAQMIMIDTYSIDEKMLELYFSNYDYQQTSIMIANGYLDLEKEEPITLKDLEGIPEKLQIVKLAHIVKERSNRAMSVEDIYNSIRGSVDVNLFSEQMYKTYVPKKYDASEVLYFKATEGFIKKNNSMKMKSMDFAESFDYVEPWKNLITNLRIIDAPGDHLTMLEEPALSLIKEKIVEVLK